MGKVRHIEVAQLWLQEKIDKAEFRLVKVSGVANLADALTKPPTTSMLTMHMKGTNQRIAQGRHEKMPRVSIGELGWSARIMGINDHEGVRPEEGGLRDHHGGARAPWQSHLLS